MAPNPELSYLDRVVMEIIETERTYVRDLRSIVEDYLAHIIDTADLPILPEQVCALFGNIEDIYEFNSELLQDLDLCENDPVEIARCFVVKSEYFEIYTQYCTNYPNSVAALTECMRNKTLLQFFMKRQEALKHPLPLGSYLLKPVQRILKYHLLLQEIAKHFDPDGAGYDIVEEAINTMTEVGWYINSMKRKHEHAVRLQEVQSLLINWPGPDLTTYGELVLEGTFRFHHAKNDRTLFLFDRLLLITKRRGENYVYKTHIACSMLMLMEGMKDSLSFSVTHYKTPKHPHTVQAKTMEEKKLWTHHIKRLILENHHTVIPQKAKDAILEMDSASTKSRFHAERKKKAQSDDFTHIRHLDITKLKNSKALLKQAEEPPNLQQLQEHQKPHQIPQQGSVDESQIQMSRTDLRSAEELKQGSEAGGAQTSDQLYTSEQEEKHDPDSHVKQDEAVNPTQDVQSSEEEEEEEEEHRGSENHSILPSSVLDKASAIAEHFISNARRNSTVTEELRSPRRIQSQDGTLNQNGPDLSFLSEREEGVAGSDRRLSRRRDSTLSKQERLIIAKIRSYYENAEQEDVGFGLKRRESLTYIPNGLVSTSISRFNRPPHSPRPTSTASASSHGPKPTTSISSTASQSSPPDQDLLSSHVDVYQRPENHQEETFRPSSEMVRVWQEMEKDVVRSPRRNRFRGSSSAFLQCSKSEPEEPGAEDLSTITEESPAQVPAADEKHSSESSVFHLARKFSQYTHTIEPANQLRRRSSDSTVTFNHTNLSPLREEPNHNIKGRLNSTPTSRSDDQIKSRSSSTARVLSPGPSSSSPLLAPYENFHWPDVRELRSKYTQLEAASHTLGSNTHIRFERAGSLDQKLGVFSWSDVSSNKSQSDYYITAQLPLPNNRTITVLEKQPSTPTLVPAPVPSPTVLRNVTLPSVSERCRVYEDLDEASVRAGAKLRTNHNKENKSEQAGSNKGADGVQQGVVRNLREKFSSFS